MKHKRPAPFVSLLALLLALPATAATERDWFSSLYTGEGVELRADERVFALYAVFNAVGFDSGPVVRELPFPKVKYSPVRQALRAHVLSADAQVRSQADAFLDAHPLELARYLSFAIHSEGPGSAAAPKGKEFGPLKGLEQILAKAWSAWKLEPVFSQLQPEFRAGLKGYLAVLDEPLSRARVLLRLPEEQEVLLFFNLLDAQGTVHVIRGEHEGVVLIVGPSEGPNLEGVVGALARHVLDPSVSQFAPRWAAGGQVLREAQAAGAKENTVEAYVLALLSRSVVLNALKAPEAAYDAASAQGYFGVKDVAKMFEQERRSIETWALDALQRVETRRPAKK